MSIKDWSTTGASNATITDATYGNINFAEGQAPSTVNDSARNTMAQLRGWHDTFHDIVSKSANYTMTADEANSLVVVDTTAGDVTITLPAVAGTDGRSYYILKSVAANSLIITAQAGETINDTLTITASNKNECVQLVSNGSVWLIVNDNRFVSGKFYLNAADQNITATGTLIQVVLDGTDHNLCGGELSAGFYAPPIEGYYFVRYGISFTGTAAGIVNVSLSTDGGTNFFSGKTDYIYGDSSASPISIHANEIVFLTPLSRVGIYALHTDGSPLAVRAVSAPRFVRFTHLSVSRVGASHQ
jgi:hypothetical protein